MKLTKSPIPREGNSEDYATVTNTNATDDFKETRLNDLYHI